MARTKKPKAVDTRQTPKGGGHKTQYPGKDPHPVSFKFTPVAHDILAGLMREKGWSASDVLEGKLRGDI